ncbi:toll/interleukin-1 receptor domain-containing protein [Haliscomenobacter sp.]|uniref:toll/interleukin-1 receptor domain-containing protein n=1 Tax=Haliscomenobacter sp. TaxID=2717303 RepID=UPI003BA91658
MSRLIPTKLFLSYSRKDTDLAEYLKIALKESGYEVFFDKEEILIGEDFAQKIQKSIQKTDALIFILSKNSIQSQWCQAEVYTAVALGKKFIPVKYAANEEFDENDFFYSFQKNINYAIVQNKNDYANAVLLIHKFLTETRRKVARRWLFRIVGLLALVVCIGLFYFYAITSLNDSRLKRMRAELSAQITNSKIIYNHGQLQNMLKDYASDDELLKQLYYIYNAAESSENARVNSLFAIALLEKDNPTRKRWFIQNFQANQQEFIRGSLVNTTLMHGNIDEVYFEKSNFSGVVWGSGFINEKEPGLSIGASKYKACHFYGNTFNPSSMILVELENCVFKGSRLELENMGDVKFYSPIDTNSSLVTNELALFENCVLENSEEPPQAGVIEILPKNSEVRFVNVLFEACHFRGFIRSKWFENCIFSNCSFPKAVDVKGMEGNGCIFQEAEFR